MAFPQRASAPPTYRPPCVFDLEAVAIDDVREYIEEPTAPANYKDLEKIAAYIEEKRVEQMTRAALDPDLARVVALGWSDGEGEPVVMVAKNEDHEATLLEMFWRRVGQGPDQSTLVGFAILTYDLRVLLRRSLYLGVKPPPIAIDKYRHPGVVDLMDELSFHGAEKFHSLNFYCKRFKLGPFPDDITGASIGAAVAADDWDAVEKHCRLDIVKEVALAKRMGVLQ